MDGMDIYTRAEIAVVLDRYGLRHLSPVDFSGNPAQYPDHYAIFRPDGEIVMAFGRDAGKTDWDVGARIDNDCDDRRIYGHTDGLPDRLTALAVGCEIMLGRRQPDTRSR